MSESVQGQRGAENAPGKEPKGHAPLQVEYRNGQFWLLDGSQLVPDTFVGPEEHHRRLFIEYERSFGRGIAKYATHDTDAWDTPTSLQKYDKSFGEEYREIASRYGKIVAEGSAKEADAMIQEIRNYRGRHPHLYEDVS